MNYEKKEWIKEIDLIKAIAIVLIVLSHLHDFISFGSYKPVIIPIEGYIAFIGLSLFFFISGFSLYYNHDFISKNKLANFYHKRAVRIYPLLWVAIIFVIPIYFYLYGFLMIGNFKVNYGYFITAFLGLQGIFYQQNPSVLFWFVGVILLYYFLYPFLVYLKSIKKIVLVSLIIFSLFVVIHLKNPNLINPYFYTFFGAFIFGIVLCWIDYSEVLTDIKQHVSNYNLKFKIMALINVFLIFTLLYFLNLSIESISIRFVIWCLLPLFAIVSIYYVAVIYKDKLIGKGYDLISKLSMSTYAIFLFFNPVLTLIVLLLTRLQIDTIYINCVIIFLGFPLVFFIGHYIQKLEYKARIRLR